MKAKQIEFRRTVSMGYPSFSNKTAGIVLEVEETDKTNEVLEKAKEWVDFALGVKQTEFPF